MTFYFTSVISKQMMASLLCCSRYADCVAHVLYLIDVARLQALICHNNISTWPKDPAKNDGTLLIDFHAFMCPVI
jgi:hypothetical protein